MTDREVETLILANWRDGWGVGDIRLQLIAWGRPLPPGAILGVIWRYVERATENRRYRARA